MKETFNYDEDKSKLKLTDMISLEFLQRFQDAFSNAVGVSSIITDEDGIPVTKGSNFTDFCMKSNRGCAQGAKRCMQSDAFGGAESAKTGKPAVYYCKNGLMDFAAPILLDGRLIGTMLGGQVLTALPDKEVFLQVAKEIGADPDEYLREIEKVKILPEEQVRAAAYLLYLVTGEFSRMGYQRLSLIKMAAEIQENVSQMTETINELASSATEVTNSQNMLNSEIKNVKSLSKEINTITEFIRDIADEIQLLGINATIEAARIGQNGLGFDVIAERIRKLSGESKTTMDKIKGFIRQINDSVTKTSELSKVTLLKTKQEENGVKEIAQSIEEFMKMSEILNYLSKE
ncbi:PocR ligand-binding domain-containing protein [Anaerocolumna xylanovorans]|uniref:Ligand-binding sensor domain-containing protein n=1 Tax=Anaerocolumna xylanovorans DSM 12503 TaxID=1121345 RepID=A0A1M7YKW8_9FIRM|nr:PocR ligand-binding domain-containing protein [Anaerocolumna xylanovorans]SHO53234.1 Ligand-binding sensor domain-containing protein [Anaerocolumna xylanovorans DSM 12503]